MSILYTIINALLKADRHTHFFLIMDYHVRKIRNRKLQRAKAFQVNIVPEITTRLTVNLLKEERLIEVAQRRLINIIND